MPKISPTKAKVSKTEVSGYVQSLSLFGQHWKIYNKKKYKTCTLGGRTSFRDLSNVNVGMFVAV